MGLTYRRNACVGVSGSVRLFAQIASEGHGFAGVSAGKERLGEALDASITLGADVFGAVRVPERSLDWIT